MRISTLTGSSLAAVLISAALFSSYHLYQGVPAAFHCLAFGALYGFFFTRYRRLAPLVIAHTLHNTVVSWFQV